MKNQKAYIIAVTTSSSFYIPDAEHIERNDSLMLVSDDEEASKVALKDGVKLITKMEGVPDNTYIDTPKNRKIISKVLKEYPEYANVEGAYHSK